MNNVILLGDIHLGIKQFNIQFYEKSQLTFFKDQLIPYMLKNKIDTIWSMGDVFDNRTSIDIRFFQYIRETLFDLFVKYNIKFVAIKGNHDIYFRNTLDVSLLDILGDLYPNNIEIISKPTIKTLNNKTCLLQPWLLPNEKVNLLNMDVDYMFMHAEINGFEMIKGYKCNNGIDVKSFKNKNIKQVYSGHFHIRNTSGKINFIGSITQLNWGDYNLDNGFIVFDTNKDKFIKNKVSQKFVKLKYNDTIQEDNPLEVSGLYPTKKYFNKENIPFKDLQNCILKFFINKAKTSDFEDYIYLLKQAEIEFEVLNNQEISLLIGTDYNHDVDDVDTKEFILQSISDTQLKELAIDIIQEVKDNNTKDED